MDRCVSNFSADQLDEIEDIQQYHAQFEEDADKDNWKKRKEKRLKEEQRSVYVCKCMLLCCAMLTV